LPLETEERVFPTLQPNVLLYGFGFTCKKKQIEAESTETVWLKWNRFL
jgi:hypothetical protein